MQITHHFFLLVAFAVHLWRVDRNRWTFNPNFDRFRRTRTRIKIRQPATKNSSLEKPTKKKNDTRYDYYYVRRHTRTKNSRRESTTIARIFARRDLKVRRMDEFNSRRLSSGGEFRFFFHGRGLRFSPLFSDDGRGRRRSERVCRAIFESPFSFSDIISLSVLRRRGCKKKNAILLSRGTDAHANDYQKPFDDTETVKRRGVAGRVGLARDFLPPLYNSFRAPGILTAPNF